MNIGFWNINKKPIIEFLETFVCEHNIDLLVLAECDMSDTKILLGINPKLAQKFTTTSSYVGSTKIRIFSKYGINSIKPISEGGSFTIRLVKPSVGPEFFLVGMHLHSKLHKECQDFIATSQRIVGEIEQLETEYGHDRTIVLGDFNMNPFEDGLVMADCFNSVMDKAIAKRRFRKVSGVKRKFFYNPMWGLMGNQTSGPSGTYFYNKSGQVNFYWNTFDQVILRPSLLGLFDESSVAVVTDLGNNSLLDRNGRPNSKLASDHLPLVFSLCDERMLSYGT